MTMRNGTMVKVTFEQLVDKVGLVVAQPGEGVEFQEGKDTYGVQFFQDAERACCGSNWFPPSAIKPLSVPLSEPNQLILIAALRWMWQAESELRDKVAKAQEALE